MKTQWMIGLLVAGLMGPGAALAEDPATEEAQVNDTQEQIDREAMQGADTSRVEKIAKQYDVPATTVERLRASGHGWGEISIQLAMAQHLAKTQSSTYPTTGDALTKVETLRAEGKGWGAAAKELGFKLGPVVSETRRTREQLRPAATTSPERAEGPAVKTERSAKPTSPRAERPSSIRPERPARAERPERSHPERPGPAR